MQNSKKEIYSAHFKEDLKSAIREKYTAFCHVPMERNAGKPVKEWESNPLAYELEADIGSENFTIDGKIVRFPHRKGRVFNLPAIPQIRFNYKNLVFQDTLEIRSRTEILIQSGRGKQYTVKCAPGVTKVAVNEAKSALAAGLSVKALVVPGIFVLVDFGIEQPNTLDEERGKSPGMVF